MGFQSTASRPLPSDPGALDAKQAELEEALVRVSELEGLLAEAKERVVRARADLDNQRRRFHKEREELRKFATEDLMRALTPALEHFSLALDSMQDASDMESVVQGVLMIQREFMGVLRGHGLEVIAPADQPFDPLHHEAVGTGCEPGLPDGAVIEVMRPGWMLNGRVLRPAMVKVNKLASPGSAPAGDGTSKEQAG